MNTLTRATINLNRNMLPLTDEARTMATRNQIVILSKKTICFVGRGCVASASSDVSRSWSLFRSTTASRVKRLVSLFSGGALRAHVLVGIVLFFTSLVAAQAQATGCGLTSVNAGKELIYPAIAKAAHIEGVVVAIVNFDHDGRPSDARIATGPEMLHRAALDYVKSLQANRYTGYRECPMVEVFRLEGQGVLCGTSPNDDMTTAYFPTFKRLDLQHVELALTLGCITTTRNQAATIIHRFHL